MDESEVDEDESEEEKIFLFLKIYEKIWRRDMD
jgi:hypothetical protein